MCEITCSILKNVPYAFEMYVSCFFGVDGYSVYVCWVQLTYSVKFLLMSCLVLSIIESGVMMSPTIVVRLSVFFFPVLLVSASCILGFLLSTYIYNQNSQICVMN